MSTTDLILFASIAAYWSHSFQIKPTRTLKDKMMWFGWVLIMNWCWASISSSLSLNCDTRCCGHWRWSGSLYWWDVEPKVTYKDARIFYPHAAFFTCSPWHVFLHPLSAVMRAPGVRRGEKNLALPPPTVCVHRVCAHLPTSSLTHFCYLVMKRHFSTQNTIRGFQGVLLSKNRGCLTFCSDSR